jgi:uncharacterized protein (DUF488 family)
LTRGRREERRPLLLYTVGHGARPIEDLTAVVQGAGIALVVDVRSFPGSRRHPQFGKDALAASLRDAGIDYLWERDLGGFRQPRPDSRHTALRADGFRGYADHMETPEFDAAVRRVMREGAQRPAAVMCAESLWWRCHRRLLADSLVARGCEVRHVMPDGRQETHRLSGSARLVDGDVVYDVAEGQQELLPPEEAMD